MVQSGPSQSFMNKLRLRLPIMFGADAIAYRYSYQLETRETLLTTLGIEEHETSCLILENGSSAITAVANWLALSHIADVIVLAPCYFTVPYALARLGMRVRRVYARRTARGYELPDCLDAPPGSAFWITNPIYNTGTYLLPAQMPTLLRLMECNVTIVADESLAFEPSSLTKALGGHPKFVSIHTPHKSICVNALKFSLVSFPKQYEMTFNHWSDVFSGGLSLSAIAAIDHFLSANYERYRETFLNTIAPVAKWHDETLKIYAPMALTDPKAIGHFATVYFPWISADAGSDNTFIAHTMEATGTAFIPGSRSWFDPANGFCLRVNLAQDSPQFRAATSRLYRYLSSETFRSQ